MIRRNQMSKIEEILKTLDITADAGARRILRLRLDKLVARERAVALAGLAAELSR
jgi:hypothetical protein